MPFKKTGTDSYTSPSGRKFNSAQVRLYYAHGGHFPGEKGDKVSSGQKSFADGGDVQPLKPAKTWPMPSRPAPNGGEKPAPDYAKGGDIRVGAYAEGGSVLGRTRNFMKEPDEFRSPAEGRQNADDDYEKTGSGSKDNKRTGDKSLPVVKPRK